MQKPHLVTAPPFATIYRADSPMKAMEQAKRDGREPIFAKPIPSWNRPAPPKLPDGVTIHPRIALAKIRKLREDREARERMWSMEIGAKAFRNDTPVEELTADQRKGYYQAKLEWETSRKGVES